MKPQTKRVQSEAKAESCMHAEQVKTFCETKDWSASRKCGQPEGEKRDMHKGSAFQAEQVKTWEAKEGRTKATGQKFCRRHGLIAQVVRAHA